MKDLQQYTDEELIVQLRKGNQSVETYLLNKDKGLV